MSKSDASNIRLKSAIRGSFSLLVLFGVPFLSYGGIDWMAGWIYMVVTVTAKLFFSRYLTASDPELVRRRQKIQGGTKGWDKIWLALYFTVFLAILVLAGLDAGRFHWSEIPVGGMVVGGAIYVGSMLLTFWAMTVNTHFEGTVRIQTDREHKVIDTGPYRYIRHPGYMFLIIAMLSIPAFLGSAVAFLPAGVTVVLFAVRTGLEDRVLKKELSGYGRYSETVRYRLVPGLW